MTKRVLYHWVLMAIAVCSTARGQQGGLEEPRVYVPYSDVAALIDPATKVVLMDRAKFQKLLSAARANARTAGSIELGQVTNATYTAEVAGEKVSLVGVLTVVSMSEKPVAVPLQFAHIGLTRVALGNKAAPLGYDESGRLIVIISGKGTHKLEVAGSTVLRELAGGGMQFGMVLPEAVAGTMRLTAPGDLEIHATVPAAGRKYDRQADRTTVDLTVGGHAAVTAVLTGSGRQEDGRAILLGESASSINVTKSHQVLSCLYTVQVLRRGVRELAFSMPPGWTVTDVTCPNLVRWAIASDERASRQILTVRLRSAGKGTQAVHIKATAAAGGDQWNNPLVNLVGNAFQRGYLMVETGEDLRVRGELLKDARQEDVYSAPEILRTAGGRLYFHWGNGWNVKLDLATVALRRSSKEHQSLVIWPEQLTLDGTFEVTAIDRRLFDMSFVLPPREARWNLTSVTVNDSDKGFEYRLAEDAGKRTLNIQLARPIEVEAAATVRIVLRQVPRQWDWQKRSSGREISFPLIVSQAEAVSGIVSVSALGDLAPTLLDIPAVFKPVPVGRMAALKLGAEVQLAYTYQSGPGGRIRLGVTRRQPRIAAESVGLVTATATKLTGNWRIDYTISRAKTRELRLLADASLGQNIKIETPGRRIAARRILPPGLVPAAKGYNVWAVTLDEEAIGKVSVLVDYGRPSIGRGELNVPLIRPIAQQTGELLAIQASEEIAVKIDSSGAKEMDAIELPPLPAEAGRLLAAFRLGVSTTGQPAQPSIRLVIAVHERYEIPAAIASLAELTTYIGADGSQHTAGIFQVANAGMQFLTIRLPERAELWSVRVGQSQAKPKRSKIGDYLVALPPEAKTVAVRVVYRSKAQDASLARLALGGVGLPGVKIARARWQIIPPPGYRIVHQQTRMQTQYLLRPKPAYEQILEAVGAVFTPSPLMSKSSKPWVLSSRLRCCFFLRSGGYRNGAGRPQLRQA